LLADEVDYYNRRANQLAQSLVENRAKLDGVYNYFIMSPSEYASWRLSADVPTYVQVSLHQNINDIYVENNNFESKVNSFVNVKVTEVKEYDLIGKIV
jgi:two-component system sensor histidine kinase YesM